MNNIQFSVLMSVYFKENPQYLDKALESVFNQTLMPNEVVLVEDGTLTSELDDIVKKYKLKYSKILKIIKYKKNRGLGIALRDGLLKCSNEIVFRMDSDDISNLDRFEKQINLFKNKNVDVVGGNIIEYDINMETITGYRKVPIENSNILKMMRKRNAMNHVTVAYKKSKVIEAGNYQNMPYFEDYYLWIRMLQNGCVFYNVDDFLVNVRCGNEMIKRRGGISYIKCIINFEKTIYKIKFISFYRFLCNVIIRTLISIVPNSIRTFFYKNILRK